MDDKKFINILEKNGQIADIKKGDDTTKLPAKVTHVRYPDGTIERIRFNMRK